MATFQAARAKNLRARIQPDALSIREVIVNWRCRMADAPRFTSETKTLSFKTMSALVIDPLPETLHSRLKQAAAAHRRSLAQETIVLLEFALEQEPSREAKPTASYWAQRTLLPEYEALLKSGALTGGTDSTQMISEERDAR